MSEPDLKTYRNWLDLKKDLEEKYGNEGVNLYSDLLEEKWDDIWDEYVYDNTSPGDLICDVWDYIDWGDFISDHFRSDSDEVIHMKRDYFENDVNHKELLNEFIEMKLIQPRNLN